MIFDYKHFLHYFRLSEDHRMVFGGRAAFFPENPQTIRRSAEILRREMIEVFPQLRDVKVEYAWGGTLGFAFDLMPHAGERDGVFSTRWATPGTVWPWPRISAKQWQKPC
jgi:glycine/D-amino acid oxidase-like deaminating enzyme